MQKREALLQIPLPKTLPLLALPRLKAQVLLAIPSLACHRPLLLIIRRSALVPLAPQIPSHGLPLHPIITLIMEVEMRWRRPSQLSPRGSLMIIGYQVRLVGPLRSRICFRVPCLLRPRQRPTDLASVTRISRTGNARRPTELLTVPTIQKGSKRWRLEHEQ
jgi:hypothetical protein